MTSAGVIELVQLCYGHYMCPPPDGYPYTLVCVHSPVNQEEKKRLRR